MLRRHQFTPPVRQRLNADDRLHHVDAAEYRRESNVGGVAAGTKAHDVHRNRGA